jgi:N-formylglutamate amidohydrolase
MVAIKNGSDQFSSETSIREVSEMPMQSQSILNKALVLILAVFQPAASACAQDNSELVVSQVGDLPVVISAPHGGSLEIPGVPPRKGEGLEAGPAGFRVVRDGGTEELALEVARQLAERMTGRPSFVISRVHRRYVDFNRPPEIAVEHAQARIVYDQYHTAVADAVRTIREKHGFGLLIDIHGQGSSAETVYRGTSNGLTVSGLRKQFGEQFHVGENSLLALLKKRNWKVHPDPFDGKEQYGFTGGHIVRTYGSHRSDGIDAIQLELGGNYRKTAVRERIAREMADAIVESIELVRKVPEKKADQTPLQLNKY